MTWFTRWLSSSVGRKQLLAVTGIVWSGFLIGHLLGNLILFVSDEKFNEYAEFLEHQPWLIPAELFLILVLFTHVGLAIRLSMENKQARKVEYAFRKGLETNPASRYMIYSGLTVLLFMVIHIIQFKFGEKIDDNLALLVRQTFANPVWAGFYVLCLVVLGLHLVHGLQSLFQTFGINHPSFTPMIKQACIAVAALLVLAFVSIPIWFYFLGGA